VQSVTLQNAHGQTIQIKRGEDAEVILIRHTRFNPSEFGRLYENSERLRFPPIVSFLAKFDVVVEPPKPGEGGAYAVIGGRLCLLEPAEIEMICFRWKSGAHAVKIVDYH
jgi:hypothetical protein